MLKSVSYGPANGKIYDSSSSFFGLPLAQFSPEDDQLPTPVEVSQICFIFLVGFLT